MNSTLKLGIVLLAVGCASFTWLLLYMNAYYPAAVLGMLSKQGYTFSITAAPAWLWGGLAIALLLVVKGAVTIGKSTHRDS